MKPPRASRWSGPARALLLAGLACCGAAEAAQLTLGAPRMGPSGWEAPVLLSLSPGEQVASMQFDVALPPGAVHVSARPGEAASQAGKQAMYSIVAPGQLRVVVAGLNQSAMSSGQVATVLLGELPAGSDAPSPALRAPVLSTPSGTRVPVEAPPPPAAPTPKPRGNASPPTPPADAPATPEAPAPPPADDKSAPEADAPAPVDGETGGPAAGRNVLGNPFGAGMADAEMGEGRESGEADAVPAHLAARSAAAPTGSAGRPGSGAGYLPGAVFDARDAGGEAPARQAPSPRVFGRLTGDGVSPATGASPGQPAGGRFEMAQRSTATGGARAASGVPAGAGTASSVRIAGGGGPVPNTEGFPRQFSARPWQYRMLPEIAGMLLVVAVGSFAAWFLRVRDARAIRKMLQRRKSAEAPSPPDAV